MEASVFHVHFIRRCVRLIRLVFHLRSNITGMNPSRSSILSRTLIRLISIWHWLISKAHAFVLSTAENCMHLPLILISIGNRQSSSLPICSHSPLQTRHRNSFCFRYQNTSFPFRLFSDLSTRLFRKYNRNFFGSARSSFGKTGSVWTSLQPKILFRNCGSRLRFWIFSEFLQNMLSLPQMNRYAIRAWNFLRLWSVTSAKTTSIRFLLENWLHLPEWMSSTFVVFSKNHSAKHPFPISTTSVSAMRQHYCIRPNCRSRRSVWKAGSIISGILWRNSKRRPDLPLFSSAGKI